MSEKASLLVRLTPKASKNALNGFDLDADGNKILKISVTAIPEKGKANKALINLLAKSLKIPKSDIEIMRGALDRNKSLIIKGLSDAALRDLLDNLIVKKR